MKTASYNVAVDTRDGQITDHYTHYGIRDYASAASEFSRAKKHAVAHHQHGTIAVYRQPDRAVMLYWVQK